jgi:hypothetical protein
MPPREGGLPRALRVGPDDPVLGDDARGVSRSSPSEDKALLDMRVDEGAARLKSWRDGDDVARSWLVDKPLEWMRQKRRVRLRAREGGRHLRARSWSDPDREKGNASESAGKKTIANGAHNLKQHIWPDGRKMAVLVCGGRTHGRAWPTWRVLTWS